MKNSLNLVFVALLFIVLGCNCSKKFGDFAVNTESNQPIANPTPFTANTTTTPNLPPTGKKASLAMAQYNQIKNGMTYQEAVNAIGSEGTEVSSSEVGKYKTATYKWEGENYSYIILTFQNDKLMFKTQANLK